QEANMLDFLACPAELGEDIERELTTIARTLAEKMGVVGLLAVEFFVTDTRAVLVNEIAPRPHNSGHHTIEATETSQFEQHLRAILNLPLGSTELREAAVMLNLVGNPDGSAKLDISEYADILAMSGAHLHLYGK